MSPLIFLDFDDVIVLDRSGGSNGYDVLLPGAPVELCRQVFHRPAIEVLVAALIEHDARLVVTTSWLRFMLRPALEQLLTTAGLDVLAQRLHIHCEAVQQSGQTRAQAIENWIVAHHRGEPYVILDDELSGTGLRGSVHDSAGRVVLCTPNMGLRGGDLATIRAALFAAPNAASTQETP